MGMRLSDVFRNEHILDDKIESSDFSDRLRFTADAAIVTYDQEKQEIKHVDQAKPSHILDLFVDMAQIYMDTYLIVCLTIEQICGKHIILKQKLIIKELHAAIKHLYTERIIAHLHSCLDEIITTAILRYEQMGLLEVRGYGNKQGSRTNFLMSHSDMKLKVVKHLDFMQSYRTFSADQA